MNKDIKISRKDLIKKCDDFLSGKINEECFETFASSLIVDDNIIWDDDVISDIIFQWDTPEIHFPITKTNVRLWKHQLKTNEDLLREHNIWDHHIKIQKEICKKHESKWNPISKRLKIGISDNLTDDPIHGLRHPKEGDTTGWYIWSGQWSDKDDFFKPLCAEHLLQSRPQIIKYSGLDVGFRFIIDKKGYEDIWYDEKINEI